MNQLLLEPSTSLTTAPETLLALDAPEAQSPFAALGLSQPSLRAVTDLGYSEPTTIQIQAIPLLLAGRDLVAEAPTGTGKTAAYGLPIVEQLDPSEPQTQVLVLVPTRELAIQVAAALHGLGRHRNLVTLPIYGGQPYERQFRALARGIQVVVGTPGRLLDHLARQTLHLDTVRTVVLDEADEMLNMGFIDDIQTLLAALPAVRQTALFSATLPPRVVRLAQQHLKNPAQVSVATKQAVGPLVRQVYYEIPAHAKPEGLARILDLADPKSAIVFVGTRLAADAVAEQLNGLGYLAQAIHGDVTQIQRERVLERFRNGRIQLLVGTDVAARGLDIPDVSHVINYDVPADAESYVHRIGRTGRAGQAGEAITIVTPRERRLLALIERGIHRRIELQRAPTREDIAARRRNVFRDRVQATIDAGETAAFNGLLDELTATSELRDIAAAALKLASEATGTGGTTTWRPAVAAPPVVRLPQGPPPALADRTGVPFRPVPQERADVDRVASSPPFIRSAMPTTRQDDLEQALGVDRPWSASKREPERGASVFAARRSDPPGPQRSTRTLLGKRAPSALMHQGTDEATTQLMLRVGKRDGVRKADLVGAIANEAKVPGASIGDVEIFDTYSYVRVPRSAAVQVETALNRTTIRGRAPRVTRTLPTDTAGTHTAGTHTARPQKVKAS